MGYEVNVVVISGNLTRDPELATLGNSSVCEFGLAWNERFKSGEEWKERVHFFDVKIWGAQGERFANHAHKGMHVTVHGRLTRREWEDRDGNKRSKIEVVADDLIYDTRTVAAEENAPRRSSDDKPRDDFRDVDFGEDRLPF